MRKLCSCGLIAIVIALTSVAAASAATTTIDFDDLTAGTAVTTISGATFVGSPTVFVPAHVATETPPNALHTASSCAASPSTCYSQEIDFASPKSQVSMDIGLDDEAAADFPIPYQLTAYDASGTVVAQSNGANTLPGGGYTPITHAVSVQSLSTDIARVVLSFGATSEYPGNSAYERRVNLDHVTFTDDTIPQPPAPGVTITSPTAGQQFTEPSDVHVSGSVSAPSGISRFCLTTSTAATIPASCTEANQVAADGSFSNLTVDGLTAGPNTITAWVQDSSERTAHTSVAVNLASVNLSATNLEVTQDIQSRLPVVNGPAGGPLTAAYNGVPLAAGRPTVARFWVGLDVNPNTGETPPVQALLYGYRNGEQIGAPLTPVEGARRLEADDSVPRPGPDAVAWSSMSSQAYTFRLPLSWEQGNVTLKAVVNPPGSYPAVGECGSCDGDNALTLSGVAFTPVRGETITPVEMIRRDDHGNVLHPDAQWSDLDTVMPFSTVVRPYQGEIDISDGDGIPDRATRQALALDKLFSWDDHNGDLITGHLIAVSQGQDLGVTETRLVCCHTHLGIDTLAQVDTSRPLTSVTHEFGHELGLNHAGTQGPAPSDPTADRACGGDSNGQHGTDWPPDQSGLLQGVGLDPRTGSGGVDGPFRVFGLVNADGTPASYFDFMSYCAGSNDAIAWISVRNWTRLLQDHATGTAGSVAYSVPFARTTASAATARGTRAPIGSTPVGGAEHVVSGHGPTLLISGIIGARGLSRIFSVTPGSGNTIRPSTSSPVSLQLSDRSGHVLSTTPVPATIGHIDHFEPFLVVDAAVKAGSATTVSLRYQGHSVAKMVKPRRVPRIRLLTLRRAARIKGTGTTLVRWRVTNPSRAKLTIAIDYAANGRRFRELADGLRGSSFRLANALLTKGSHARLRVRVTDGWNTAAAKSAQLRVAGPAARGAIAEPFARATVAADGSFVAQGSAWDDRGRPIPGAQMRWYVGARYLGSGTSVTIRGIAPGRRRLRLVTDADGRRATFDTTVRVRSAAPSLTVLRVPRSIGAAQRAVSLLVAAPMPGTLTVNGRRFRVGSAARVLHVPVTAGARVRLSLTLTTATGRLRLRRTLWRR